MINSDFEANILIISQSDNFGTRLLQELSTNNLSVDQSPNNQIDIREFDKTAKTHARILYFRKDLTEKCVYRLFLTSKTVCVLVADQIVADKQKYTNFWTHEIRRYSQCPIALIFPSLDNKSSEEDTFATSCLTDKNITCFTLSEFDHSRLTNFKTFLVNSIESLFGEVYDISKWAEIKESIKQITKDLITIEEFNGICSKKGILDKDEQKSIALWLRDSGTILAFLSDFRLQRIIILNPQWVANAINSLHNSNAIFTNHAILESGMIDDFRVLTEYQKIEEKIFIIDLLSEFDLCLEIESSDNQKKYLLPTLVDKDSKFVGSKEDWENARVELSFEYSTFPFHFITYITAKLYSYAKYHTHWQNGCLIFYGKNETSKALITLIPEKNRVQVLIQGVDLKTCNEFGVLIREAINKLNTKLGSPYSSLLYNVVQKQDNLRLFISYAHKDKAFAKKLASELENQDIQVWWDYDSLKGGQDWQKEIERGIKGCDFFLVVLTTDAVASEWVGNEILYASQAQKTIIPLYLKKCDIPIGLIKKQYVDFEKQTQKAAIKELLVILKSSE